MTLPNGRIAGRSKFQPEHHSGSPAGAGPVRIKRADGSVEVQPAYDPETLRDIILDPYRPAKHRKRPALKPKFFPSQQGAAPKPRRYPEAPTAMPCYVCGGRWTVNHATECPGRNALDERS